MTIVKHILSFASGEISPLLDGRTDIPKYAGACRRLENFIPTPQGGLLKRPGLQLLGHVPNSEAPDWSTGQDHEKGDRVSHLEKTWICRVNHESAAGNAPGSGAKLPDASDGGVLKDVWSIHPESFGRLVEFQVTMHRSVVLAMGGKRMKFVDKGRMVKTSNLAGAPDFRIDIPWQDEELRSLRWKQVNNVMFFVHPLHHPYQLTRKTATSWTLEEVDFGLNAPLLDENTKGSRKITASFQLDAGAPGWLNNTQYEAGDRVADPDGNVWVARFDHTSSNDDPDNRPGTDFKVEDPSDGVKKKLWRKTISDSADGDDDYHDTASAVGQRVTLTCTSAIFKPSHVGSVWEIAAKREPSRFEVSHAAIATVSTTGTDNSTYSKVLVVQGAWSFITFGTWVGAFTIQISDDGGETWAAHRQYRSTATKLRNASTEGHEDSRVLMRLKFRVIAGDGTAPSSGTSSTPPHALLSTTEGRIRGLVRITGFVEEEEGHQVKGKALSPVEFGTTAVWREGAWSNQQGFPRCIEMHQNRLLLGATARRPHTIWGSAVDDYLNFKRGTDADMSYVHTLAIGTRDPILWMDSNRTLVVGNGGGEFTLRGENGESPITPEFGICDRHSSFGTHQGGAGHIVSDTVSLFVQNGGRALREMAYSFQSDKYESANLNLLSEHLFKGPIADVAVQRQPFQIVWVVAGGQLFSMTYERSQEVVAWARHPVGGEVIALCGVRRSAEDGMHFLIRRGTRLAIERFVPGGILEPKDGTFLDSHTTIDGGGGGDSSYQGVYDIANHPLRGRMVCGFRTGQLMKGQVLGPAKLDADFFKGVSGPVTLGLPFRAICQPVTPELQLENGSSRSRDCRIHKIVPSLYRSRGGKFGEKPSGPLDALEAGSASGLFTGEVEKEFDGGFSPSGDFCIISDEPHPFTLRSVVLKLNYTGDVR